MALRAMPIHISFRQHAAHGPYVPRSSGVQGYILRTSIRPEIAVQRQSDRISLTDEISSRFSTCASEGPIFWGICVIIPGRYVADAEWSKGHVHTEKHSFGVCLRQLQREPITEVQQTCPSLHRTRSYLFSKAYRAVCPYAGIFLAEITSSCCPHSSIGTKPYRSVSFRTCILFERWTDSTNISSSCWSDTPLHVSSIPVMSTHRTPPTTPTSKGRTTPHKVFTTPRKSSLSPRKNPITPSSANSQQSPGSWGSKYSKKHREVCDEIRLSHLPVEYPPTCPRKHTREKGNFRRVTGYHEKIAAMQGFIVRASSLSFTMPIRLDAASSSAQNAHMAFSFTCFTLNQN